jgi:hypothetical protein
MHVGTIARRRRAARTGQNGDGTGEGRAPQQGSSRPPTAMRRSPPRHSSREAARRARGNDIVEAGDTEARRSGSDKDGQGKGSWEARRHQKRAPT